jgi:hypothetical protein
MLDPVLEDITDADEYPSAVLSEHLGKCRVRLREAVSAMFDVARRGEHDADRLGQEVADYLVLVDVWERIATELGRRGHDSPDRRPGLAAEEARRTVDKVLVEFFSVKGGNDDHGGGETDDAIIAEINTVLAAASIDEEPWPDPRR